MNNSNLNDKQTQAVTIIDTPLRIIAGAGSGKTRVITTKIAYLIQVQKIMPYRILAVTFTNKAANEMKNRITSLIGTNSSTPLICTFHSFCLRVLKIQYVEANLSRDFQIIDTDDAQKIVQQLLKGKIPDKELNKSAKTALSKISSWRNNGVDPSEAVENSFDERTKQYAKCFQAYVDHLANNNLVDFDGLLLIARDLFHENKEVLEKWRDRFDYILVDEFQDTNYVQYELVKMLTKNKNNLTVVGDPDQTIYSWRGARVNIILDLKKDYPNLQTIVLDQNYRSTQNILNLANSFIDHNKVREKKNIYSENQLGVKPVLSSYNSYASEGSGIALKIKELVQTQNYRYSDFFVLFRTNAWSRNIENALTNYKIPYVFKSGLRFRDRRVIKDIAAMMKLIVFKDNFSAERALGLIPKIGEVTINKLISKANSGSNTIFDVLIDEEFVSTISKYLLHYVKVFVTAEKMYLENVDIEKFAKFLVDEFDYISIVKKTVEKDEEAIQNINAFYDQMREYQTSFESVDNKILSFLQEEILVSEDGTENPNQVTLMTIHSAKGLEDKVVFIAGINDGVFPNKLSQLQQSQLEEERRALYVAITRAEEQLFLSFVQGEYSYITNSAAEPSIFINELNYDFISTPLHVSKTSYIGNSTDLDDKAKQELNQQIKNFFNSGDRVEHNLFGFGTVVKIVESFVSVAFDNPVYGVKAINGKSNVLKKTN